MASATGSDHGARINAGTGAQSGLLHAAFRTKALVLLTLLSLTVAVVAGVVLRQDVTTNPSSATPDVIFANGADYSVINSAGFATVTLGTSATSATLAVSSVPGAADLALGDVLKLTNQDGSQDYNVTLKRSTTLDSSISEFTLHVFNATDVEKATWDASSSASSSTFALAASTTYDITIDFTIDDGTAAGALSSFDIQFELTPT